MQVETQRALEAINEYQRTRNAKLDLIEQIVIANGFELEEFLKLLTQDSKCKHLSLSF